MKRSSLSNEISHLLEQLESSYLVAASKQKCDFTMDLSNSAIMVENEEDFRNNAPFSILEDLENPAQ